MPLSVRIGIGLILLGVAGRAAIVHWMSTRIVYPVDMPVSLARGHIRTGPFRLNLNANYAVYIAPGTDWRWDSAHPECNPYGHLQTRWVLYENGKVIDRLQEPTILPWPSGFSAGPGVYELDVEVMSQFSCLDSLRPRLEVIANAEVYELAALIARIGLFINTYIGFVFLTFVPIIRFLHSFERSETVTGSSSVGQDCRWAQSLPLRRPISGLPGFGAVGAIFYALIAMVMMTTTVASVYTSQGLWVRLLTRGAALQGSDPWAEPLVVLAKGGGTARSPDLYVNSKLVAWEDFDRVLKQELSRRREWVVYVGGDDSVAWQDVVSLIDLARRDQATVYLVTEPQSH